MAPFHITYVVPRHGKGKAMAHSCATLVVMGLNACSVSNAAGRQTGQACAMQQGHFKHFGTVFTSPVTRILLHAVALAGWAPADSGSPAPGVQPICQLSTLCAHSEIDTGGWVGDLLLA